MSSARRIATKHLALRLTGAAMALIVCAWFALGFVQAHAIDQATAIITGSQSVNPSAVTHVRSLLSTAGTLNPDSAAETLRGELAQHQGEKSAALKIFKRVLRDEPANITVWSLAVEVGDTRALRNIVQLEPDVP